MTGPFLTRDEWVKYLKERYNVTYHASTFGKMATTGGGPDYVLIGGRALSTAEWLDQWVQKKSSKPRSSTSVAA